MLKEKLKEIQTRKGLSDYKFADKLGVSHQLWQMTRTGKREIGQAVLQGTMKAYPELDRDVLLFLQGDVVIDASIVGDATTPSEKSSSALFSRLLKRLRGLIVRIKVPKLDKPPNQNLRGKE